MRLKAIICQVLSREFEQAIARSPHSIELEILPMGLHDYGVAMRPRIQQQIDASDASGFDAILLGYALCGRGTDGLTAGITPLVLPRAHDCIGILMGGRRAHERYFENHPGVYYRSPGWIEFQKSGRNLEPAWAVARNSMGERRSREELIQQYGEENGAFLYEQFTAYRRAYSGLTYMYRRSLRCGMPRAGPRRSRRQSLGLRRRAGLNMPDRKPGERGMASR
jgi:hypothetical protein